MEPKKKGRNEVIGFGVLGEEMNEARILSFKELILKIYRVYQALPKAPIGEQDGHITCHHRTQQDDSEFPPKENNDIADRKSRGNAVEELFDF